jgi:hypothetical protein
MLCIIIASDVNAVVCEPGLSEYPARIIVTTVYRKVATGARLEIVTVDRGYSLIALVTNGPVDIKVALLLVETILVGVDNSLSAREKANHNSGKAVPIQRVLTVLMVRRVMERAVLSSTNTCIVMGQHTSIWHFCLLHNLSLVVYCFYVCKADALRIGAGRTTHLLSEFIVHYIFQSFKVCHVERTRNRNLDYKLWHVVLLYITEKRGTLFRCPAPPSFARP